MKSIEFGVKKTIIIHLSLLLQFTVLSCGVNFDEPSSQYHAKVTIDSNLKNIHIDHKLINAQSVYPVTVFEETGNLETSVYLTLFPVADTGYIKFSLYSAVGINLPPLQLKDTLRINTPIDTAYIYLDISMNNTSKITIRQ